jgi:LPS sulfotransferase NodH
VTYEELAAAPTPTVCRVLEHIGVDVPDGLEIAGPQLEAQADEMSEEWVAKVHSHLSALEAPTTILATG